MVKKLVPVKSSADPRRTAKNVLSNAETKTMESQTAALKSALSSAGAKLKHRITMVCHMKRAQVVDRRVCGKIIAVCVHTKSASKNEK
jgi:hypothetical protein